MSFEASRLTDLMRSSVDDLEQPDRWSEIPGRVARARQQRRRRRAGGAAAVAAAAGLTVLATSPSQSAVRHQVTVSPSVPHPTSLPVASTSPSGGTVSTTLPDPSPTLPRGYLPLFPFTSGDDAAAWERSYRSQGAQPWHLSASQTAVAFAGYLGYSQINLAVSDQTTASGAHVAIGYRVPGGTTEVAAVVHLVRYGDGSNAPWEVVGTDDTTFTLTAPAYGSRVPNAFTAGGAITGVDESITLKVFQAGAGSPSFSSCCHPAGGSNTPWSIPVNSVLPRNSVLIIAASTGGHVATVERFAVTGVHD